MSISKTRTISIARCHIMAAIESAPCTLDFPKYSITTSLYRAKGRSCAGVRVTWEIKGAK